MSSLSPARTSGYSRRIRAVALAVPTLGLLLTGLDVAAAAPSSGTTPYVARNTATGATVTTPTGASHKLAHSLQAVAADGTVQLVTAKVTAARTATVAVDGTTGVARILGPTVVEPGTRVYAGGGALVLHSGSSFSLLDPATGRTTELSGVPASTGAERRVTAVAATADGAIVATSDAHEPGTTGHVDSARLWKLTEAGATVLFEQPGAHVPAVTANASGFHAILVSTTTDDLTLRTVTTEGTTDTPVGAALPSDVVSLEVGYGSDGSTPVLSLTSASGVRVVELGGDALRTYKAGTRVHLSATDVKDPAKTSNALSKKVTLTGVRAHGPVVRYGAKVTPKATATAYGVVPASSAPAAFSMLRSGKRVWPKPGRSITLTDRTCFTATSGATVFTKAATPVTQCVSVLHKLVLKSFDSRRRTATVSTTAGTVRVEVARNGRWVGYRTVAVRGGVARFQAPAGSVRVVASATAKNATATLTVTSR